MSADTGNGFKIKAEQLCKQHMPPISGLAGAIGAGGFVVARSISLAPPQAAGLAHSAAPPLPSETASRGFPGGPGGRPGRQAPAPIEKALRHRAVELWKSYCIAMSRCGGCATRGFPPSRARNGAALRLFRFVPSLRSNRAAPHAFALLSTCRLYRGSRGQSVRGGFVVARSISLAPPQAAGLAHSAAPPLPRETASRGFPGAPVVGPADKPQPP